MLNEEKSASGGDEQNNSNQMPTPPQIDPISPTSQTSPIFQTPPVVHKSGGLKSKLPWIIIILLLVIIAIFGGYVVLGQTKNQTPTPSPTPTEAQDMTGSDKLSPGEPKATTAAMKTFTSAKLKDIGFSGYTLEYPEDWVETSERNDAVGTAKLTLTKGQYSIIIQQGPMGGSICIYEGALPEGPVLDKRGKTYVDIITSFGNLRRTEEVMNGKTGYGFCQENEQEAGAYGLFTSVGAMSASAPTNPDPEIIGEVEKIVESIKTN